MLIAEVTTTGFQAIVDTLQEQITSANLFGTVAQIIPFVCVMVGFAFGYRVLRKVIKGASRGKSNV